MEWHHEKKKYEQHQVRRDWNLSTKRSAAAMKSFDKMKIKFDYYDGQQQERY